MVELEHREGRGWLGRGRYRVVRKSAPSCDSVAGVTFSLVVRRLVMDSDAHQDTVPFQGGLM